MSKYEELVELLDDVGVLQLQEEWALQIKALIDKHRLTEKKINQQHKHT